MVINFPFRVPYKARKKQDVHVGRLTLTDPTTNAGKSYIEDDGSGNVKLFDSSGAGVSLSATELGLIDGLTPGTVTASKAVTADANKDVATIRNLTISGNLVTGSTTLSEAELGVLDGVTAGTASASKAAVLSAGLSLVGHRWGVQADITGDTTLVAGDSGKIFILDKAASLTVTLPALTTGFWAIFLSKTATTSGVGYLIHPVGTDQMKATFITTPANAKGALNTQATAKMGDALLLIGGNTTWYAMALGGTWTRET